MTTEAGESLVYRPYKENDIPFIRSSWANSYYKGVSKHKSISPNEFHNYHRQIINRFFERSQATVIIVHHESEPDLIIGWIAVELISTHLIIHYVYIKNTFKHESNILENLIKRVNNKNQNVLVTHLTDKAERIIKSNNKYKSFRFVPHLI